MQAADFIVGNATLSCRRRQVNGTVATAGRPFRRKKCLNSIMDSILKSMQNIIKSVLYCPERT
jgi:hypothetical protein